MAFVIGSYIFTENPDGTVTITDANDGSLYISTAYASAAYYTDVYQGTAISSGADQAKALELASDAIDELTFNQITDAGFANLTDRQKNMIQKACCMIADDLFDMGYLQPGMAQMTGFSLGDFSIQKQPGQVIAAGIPVGGRPLALLRSTNLMYPGVI